MISSDRRATERRGVATSTSIGLGAVLGDERRTRRDRRAAPRRLSDVSTIAHVAQRIGAGHTRLEVIVDGTDGLRLVAMFKCGCSAVEPVGAGSSSVRAELCAEHAEPAVRHDRRRNNR
jgi:hypothetical protein